MKAKFTKQQIEDFKRYVKVQSSGRFNMLDPNARIMTALPAKRFGFVQDNYEALEKESNRL